MPYIRQLKADRFGNPDFAAYYGINPTRLLGWPELPERHQNAFYRGGFVGGYDPFFGHHPSTDRGREELRRLNDLNSLRGAIGKQAKQKTARQLLDDAIADLEAFAKLCEDLADEIEKAEAAKKLGPGMSIDDFLRGKAQKDGEGTVATNRAPLTEAEIEAIAAALERRLEAKKTAKELA